MTLPKIRFGEYSSNWIASKIGDIATVTSGGTPSRDNKKYWGGNIPWVTTSEIKYKNIYDSKEKITAEGLKHSSAKLFNPGTILMAMYGQGNTRGDVAKLEIEAATNQACAAIIPHKDFDVDFVFQYLIRQYEEIRGMSNEGGQKNLSGSIVKDISLHFPEQSEQQKIASFLSNVDQKIRFLTKKHELLVQYKKGVMQKIFNQEIQFKDKGGKDFPRWDSCTLNERVSSIGSGGTPKSTTAAYYNGGIPWVSIADMTEQGKYISKTKKTLSSEGLKNSSAKLFPVGTVLYAMYASLGECSLAGIGVSTSQAILGIQTKPSELNNEYLYHWLCSIKDRVILMGQQGTQSNLNLEIVKKFEMNLPSLPEQLVIKSFLNALDENIRISGKRVELIKHYKQGLLQQMFV